MLLMKITYGDNEIKCKHNRVLLKDNPVKLFFVLFTKSI
jgi:hypothetical protein